MFDHSIKVPRLYKSASKVAKEVSEGKGSIKQLVYECKHPNIKAVYALVVHVFQKATEIETVLKKSKLLTKEPRFDIWLAKILISELLWGKKHLSGQSKPVKTILAYEQIFKAHLSDVVDDEEGTQQVGKPRYVRINTLKLTVNEAIQKFEDEGWILKHCFDTHYQGFLDAVSNLGEEEFMVDLHMPYLLIFPPKTQFYQHPAYKDGSIILQDKASCFPVHILNPEPGSTVLDMCAAPGMKTSHCAATLDNQGKIYAVEIGKKRFEILKKIVNSCGATCVETINRDVLTLSSKECPSVEYILVDPSCSGSGITDRVEIGQQETEQQENRLQKLAGFQIKMLRHALTRFPKARRVVYSTCSVYAEENEDVVRQVLETCQNFKLVPAAQFVGEKWYNFGSSAFGDLGTYCLYAKPDIDLTSGFFVAVFERLEEGESNRFLNYKLFTLNKEKKRRRRNDEDNVEYDGVRSEDNGNQLENEEKMEEETNTILEDGKRKKKKKRAQEHDEENNQGNVVVDNTELPKKSKKKHKEQKEVDEANDYSSDKLENYQSNSQESKVKSKKKRKHQNQLEDEKIAKIDIIKQEDIILENDNRDITSKRKKKKKSKEHDGDQEKSEENNCNNVDLETSNIELPKKRKKKKKHQEDEEVESKDVEAVQNDEVKIKKKKGTAAISDNLDHKRKKKKSKELNENNETEGLVLENSKEKKKKNKYDSTGNIIDFTETKKRKKNKVKGTENSDLITATNNVEIKKTEEANRIKQRRDASSFF